MLEEEVNMTRRDLGRELVREANEYQYGLILCVKRLEDDMLDNRQQQHEMKCLPGKQPLQAPLKS